MVISMVVSNRIAKKPRRHCSCDHQAGIDGIARGRALWYGLLRNRLLWSEIALRILIVGCVEICRWWRISGIATNN